MAFPVPAASVRPAASKALWSNAESLSDVNPEPLRNLPRLVPKDSESPGAV